MQQLSDIEKQKLAQKIAEIPKIFCVLYDTFITLRSLQTEEQRKKEDLQDKKAVWLDIVSNIPQELLTDKEKDFVEKYRAENLKPSIFAFYKREIEEFRLEQKRKYELRIKKK